MYSDALERHVSRSEVVSSLNSNGLQGPPASPAFYPLSSGRNKGARGGEVLGKLTGGGGPRVRSEVILLLFVQIVDVSASDQW